MAKTTSAEMDALHAQLANTLKAEIDSYRKPVVIKDEEGNPLEVQRDKKGLVALLSVARQFLKDNEITASALPGSPIKSLAESLPFPGDEFSDDGDIRH